MRSVRKIFLIFFLMRLLSAPMTVGAEEGIPYKLALLHAKNEDPEKVLLNRKVEPSASVEAEFKWILQGLQNRCVDTENSLANTIVETWYITRHNGGKMTLLEIARALSQVSQNTNLFGQGKINFRLVSKYWLAKHFIPTLQK